MCKSLQSCPTLCNSTDYSPPGSSVHGILQARILEWVANFFSRGSAQTQGSCQQLPTGLHQKEALEGAGRAGRRDGFFLQDAGSWECQAAVTARPSSSRPTCGSSRTSLALRTDTHRTNLIQSQKETPAPAGTPSSEVWVLSPRPLLQTQPGSTPSLEAWAAPPQGPFSKLTKA